MKPLLPFRIVGHLLCSILLLLTSGKLYSQCSLNATISGNTSVCTGSTTLTANATGASNCAGTEGVGLIYTFEPCQTNYSFPASVTPNNCGVSLSSTLNFSAVNDLNSCTDIGLGAEGSSQGICAMQSTSAYFNDPYLSNGFHFEVTGSAVSSGMLSKISFYVGRYTGSATNLSSSTKFGIRITDPTESVVYYEQSGLSVPNYSWGLYTFDFTTDTDFILSSTPKRYRVFIEGYQPDVAGQVASVMEIDQVRVYYGCASSATINYSWTGPNGFTSSQPSITATTAGTYTATVTDCNGCTVTKSVNVTGCANCDISFVTATPTTCNSSTNTYSTSGYVYFSNQPSNGTLTVSDGTANQTLYPPFISPMAYSLTGIAADGSTHTVSASFSATNCSNSGTYTAPQSCGNLPCTISSVTATPSSCNASTNTYSVSGSISFSNPPTSGTLTVSDGTATQTFSAPFASSLSYTLTGLNANGVSHIVTASFSGVNCSKTATYTAPQSCGNFNCTVTLSTIPANCDPTTNTYSVSGRATIFNAPGGSIITFTDGTTSQTYTIPSSQISTTWVDYTLTGFTSNGTTHTVSAIISNGASCSGNTTYTAPTSCLCTNPTPSVNSPTICAGSSATLTVSNCAGTVSWNDGSTGLTKTVSPTATTTYTATCSVGTCTGSASGTVTVTTASNPTPSVNSPTICTGNTATLTVSNCTGTVTWNDGSTGLTKSVSPTTTTSYTATCSVTTGNCSGTGTATATVTVTTKPTISINTTAITCSADFTTYSITFTSNGTVTTDKGTVSGTTVSGIPSGQTVTLTATLNGCTATASATKDCTCPTINPPVGTSKEYCEGDAVPALTVTVDAGLQADWYSVISGGAKVATGLSYTPTAAGDYYVEAINTTSGCKSATRTKVSLVMNLKPTISAQATCSANGLTYSVIVTTNAVSILADKGTVSGMTVTGVPAGQTVTITATSAKGCKATTSATQNCTAPVFDLALMKKLSTGQSANVVAGSIVKFTISIINQGNVDATNVQVSDYIPTGLTLNDANWTATAGVATLNTVIASLPARQTVTRDITFKVGTSVTGTITNFAEISAASNAQNLLDVDSTPDANSTNDGTPKNDVVNENGKTGGDEDDHDPESITVTPTPKGSLGDFVWKDSNNNGIQDETTPNEGGVAGVQIELFKDGTLVAKDTTDATGKYLFTNLDAGTYKIKVLSASIPVGCEISSLKDAPSDDARDSDVDRTTGESGNYEINPLDPTKKDILTVDAALVVPCVKSKVTLTGAPICSADAQTYSISFSLTNKIGILKSDKGTLSGTNPYTLTGIPSGVTVKITDSLSAVCKFDTLITGPNCNCNPALPKLLVSSFTACIGDTFPTLKATVVGLATIEWFTQATGGSVVFTGLNYKPSGTVPATGAVFYAQARSTDPTCPTAISTSRVAATINAQNCLKEVDLTLKKSINTKIAQIGNIVTFTLKVWNESNNNATGVEVTDSIATTVQFLTGSFIASRGSATFTGNVIKWNIGNIASNGDTVTLTYRVKATQEGVHFNTAEICKTNEKDVDSTPCNHKEGEDDIDRQCFTVPFKLCPNEKVEAVVPSTYTNVQWFKNGSSTAIASGNVVLLSDVGTYTFTASNQTCPAEGCCPIIIETETNCCPAELCIPFTIKKKKK